ncbi:preprotein translocase subunit SecE [Rothia sp. P6271]|uniref:preprotein translocase subunit SecE n=1 Tax=unclassified Rothia (in: high G+C Gram-positive bacteria) TaxID=2689056 RepID=UPI003ACA81E5
MAETATNGTAATQEDGVTKRRGIFARIFQFIREVISELKKVTTPTRKELVNYVIIVLGFVTFMILLIFGLDYLFGQAAFWIFGNGTIK